MGQGACDCSSDRPVREATPDGAGDVHDVGCFRAITAGAVDAGAVRRAGPLVRSAMGPPTAPLALPGKPRLVQPECYENVATLMAMSVTDHMSLAEVKNRLSEVVDQVERERGRVVITKHGRRAAVVMSLDDLESLEETLDVLADQPLLEKVRKSIAELAAGKATVLTKDEVLADLRRT